MTAPIVDDGMPFNRRTALIITACGLVAFFCTLVLGAYAPDLRNGNNGGGHALSNSAIGYSALVALAQATGRSPVVVRDERQFDSEDLLVVSPDDATVDLTKMLQARTAKGTLVILPKWSTTRSTVHRGWVQSNGLLFKQLPEAMFAPMHPLTVTRRRGDGAMLTRADFLETDPVPFREPKVVQTVAGKDLKPLLVDSHGGTVLGMFAGTQLFVLADPDLLDNHGLADPGQARAALTLLDTLNSTDADGILFDVTMNGLGHSRSPLRLMFDPPFLAVTLALLAAFLLAAWQATTRFGDPVRRARAIAFGKRALVDNSAAMIRRAGREVNFGPLYADVIRSRAAALFRLSPTLASPAIDERLDDLAPAPFTPLAKAANNASNRGAMLVAAQRLNRWIEEIAK